MTKISITVYDPRKDSPDEQPSFHITCQGCGHDDILTKLISRNPLYGPLMADAYMRAEMMFFDHLSGDGRGGGRCPIEAVVSHGIWDDRTEYADEEPDLCTTQALGSDRIGAACPDCGHTNIVHPNPQGNPSLTHCLFCSLEANGV